MLFALIVSCSPVHFAVLDSGATGGTPDYAFGCTETMDSSACCHTPNAALARSEQEVVDIFEAELPDVSAPVTSVVEWESHSVVVLFPLGVCSTTGHAMHVSTADVDEEDLSRLVVNARISDAGGGGDLASRPWAAISVDWVGDEVVAR